MQWRSPECFPLASGIRICKYLCSYAPSPPGGYLCGRGHLPSLGVTGVTGGNDPPPGRLCTRGSPPLLGGPGGSRGHNPPPGLCTRGHLRLPPLHPGAPQGPRSRSLNLQGSRGAWTWAPRGRVWLQAAHRGAAPLLSFTVKTQRGAAEGGGVGGDRSGTGAWAG